MERLIYLNALSISAKWYSLENRYAYEVNTAGDVKQLVEMHTDVKFLPNQPSNNTATQIRFL